MFAVQEPPAVEVPYVQPCVSLAIQGRILSQEAINLPDSNPDEIVIRSPWRIRFHITRIVLGEFQGTEIEAIGVSHSRIGDGYGRTFLFSEQGGRYQLLTISPRAIGARHDLQTAAEAVDTTLCEPA
jgi:hypothetical protein